MDNNLAAKLNLTDKISHLELRKHTDYMLSGIPGPSPPNSWRRRLGLERSELSVLF